MPIAPVSWQDLDSDNPIPLLTRQKLLTDRALVANVTLEPGCVVAVHRHESEQVAVMLSGHARWKLGEEEREIEMRGGEVLHLPSNFPHGLIALEACHIIDILSPPGAMGVDSQPS